MKINDYMNLLGIISRVQWFTRANPPALEDMLMALASVPAGVVK